MMLEYVSYHSAGTPVTSIAQKYRNVVIANVTDWITVLEQYIPQQEILNYCVGHYYNRSMITLASFIMEKFADIAYCPGEAVETFTLPDDLRILAPGKDTAEKMPISKVQAGQRVRKAQTPIARYVKRPDRTKMRCW